MKKQELTFGYAAFVVIVCFSLIMFPAVFLGARTQPLFLLSWLVAFPLCSLLGFSYKQLQTGMMSFMARCLVPMTIVLCVGALIGTWNACGTVPMITKLGLQTINPQYFMVMSFFICIIFSLFTGTSFGTCGTAGVALMGVGLSMGMDPVLVAGPIICGAFFGDAISPLSDSTNMAAGSVQVDLIETIKYQMTTTVPTCLICTVLYYFLGVNTTGATADISVIQTVINDIDAHYKLGWITLLPMAVVLVMLLMKIPSIPSIISGSLAGFLVAWLYQGHSFKSVVQYMWGGYTLVSDNIFIAKIFSRGGITSMSGTAFLFVFAFGLFGILSTAGVIDKVVEPLTNAVKSRMGGTISTVIMGTIANVTSASGNFSFVFTGNLMKPVYEKAQLSKWDLTRAMSVGCLWAGLLVPWNANPLTVAGFLGVDPWAVIPYVYSPFVGFAVLIIVTAFNLDRGYKQKNLEEIQTA